LRRSPRLVLVVLVVGVALVAGAAAFATDEPAIHTLTPHSEDQITNIDVLRQQIRNYYGDPFGTGRFSSDSYYAKEARSVAEEGREWIATASRTDHSSATKAIVLDVDDTTLATWNYEVYSNWDYDPATNATFVTEQRFPKVPGMVRMVRKAVRKGFAIFYLTGRPTSQEQATLGNLTNDGIGVDAGYPAPTTLPTGEDGLFTKPDVADYPDYLQEACAADPGGKCTTVHYKSATRAYIESLGYEVVGNFGDQFSDLEGGHANRTFKLPNPNYFLP
jgi:hypothetical protein